MSMDLVIGGVTAVGLLAYLVAVLMHPEKY